MENIGIDRMENIGIGPAAAMENIGIGRMENIGIGAGWTEGAA